MDAEERARREAVRRAMAGEPVASIMAALGRSRRWVFKWLERYQPKRADWAGARSRAPGVVANKSSAELEALVLKVRARLDADPWAQVGASAIAWELNKLGVRPLPELRTIERILQRAGVRRRAVRTRYVAKGTPYPAPVAPGPNAVQEADIIGPRHLAGGVLFYVLSAVDLGRHAAAWEILPSKADLATAEALLRLWSRLGIPGRLKLDNWLVPNVGRSLPLVVHLCLALGVIPVFIPFAEPWRQGTVEHANDTFDKRFFRSERFSGLRHLLNRLRRFEPFHNAHHRYAALKGATPDELTARLGFVPRRPPQDFTIPEELPRKGQVEFIRLIRSDRLLRIMSVKIELPEALVHEYVTAVLDVRREELDVIHRGRRVKRVKFRL